MFLHSHLGDWIECHIWNAQAAVPLVPWQMKTTAMAVWKFSELAVLCVDWHLWSNKEEEKEESANARGWRGGACWEAGAEGGDLDRYGGLIPGLQTWWCDDTLLSSFHSWYLLSLAVADGVDSTFAGLKKKKKKKPVSVSFSLCFFLYFRVHKCTKILCILLWKVNCNIWHSWSLVWLLLLCS